MPTPHINANPGDFAQTVLLPGDPLRAQYIAKTFLQDAKEVTNVRNILGFTGTYQGQKVSVMGSGMGIPSCSIYAHELYNEYGVENIIRVGSAGAISPDVHIRDVVIAMGACTDSNVNRVRFKGHDFAAIADYQLLRRAVDSAESKNLPVRVGNIFSADLFYTPDAQMFDVMEKHGVLAVEMEAAGLYGVAAECGKAALCVVTISDHIRTGEATTSEERQSTFNDMIELTLDSLL
ncbi:purine-nucleoside phosphorylase [Celerinatantimonas diazotrophica]|uniref:Purine nucleoside phosphorylase DeoD-type n=1 Tax=Celerinatantimonas diazotrophica TaxID=412034 RepID=A0A4R1JAK7_9GAMM|nr:purine-nucleoside phosphorylase [Celerinatantimonas diazotrophica]TCK47129.1 purine-nucleoside phosphorylase [Celerinatantimonas diazotrophica]CAG9295901.1 Purine nucleoside phosphorylase DeoD-type [Celerinatantimonas diazotrophica]